MEQIEEGYVRVSDILSIFQAYAFVDKKKLQKAQMLGTDIHDAIEAHLKDEWRPLNSKQLPYFESFKKFLQDKHFSDYVLENRLYHCDLQITGKPDFVGHINGVPTILDWKTGSWAHPEIWDLQGHFYALLLGDTNIEEFQFVQLKSDGDHPHVYKFPFQKSRFETCLKAIELYRYFKSFDNNPPMGS